jgi:hypothetical protein
MSCRLRGCLSQQGIGDLVVDVLLLEHLLVRELDLAVKVLKSCGLAKAEELVVDEAILEVVKLVDVLHNLRRSPQFKLTIILLSGVQKLGTLIQITSFARCEGRDGRGSAVSGRGHPTSLPRAARVRAACGPTQAAPGSTKSPRSRALSR